MVEDRLGFINAAVTKLRRLSLLPDTEFLREDRPAAAESYLRRALEAMFDIGRHIVAKRAGRGLIEYREIAAALAEMRIVSEAHSERLRLMAGYRNRLVHFYHEIGDKELHGILKSNLEDMETFVREIRTFLASYESQRPS